MGVLPLWEANVMSFGRNMGRKAKISGYFIALVFWENSLYSSYTSETIIWLATLPDDGSNGGFFHKKQPKEWQFMTLNIRQSSAADATGEITSTLVTLINAVYQEAEGDMWKPDNTGRTNVDEVGKYLIDGELFIAEINGEIVGTVKIEHIGEKTLAFGMLVANPDIRGKGIGRELVKKCESHAIKNGYTIMQLELLTPRHWENASKEFLKVWYARIGYKPTKPRPFEEVSEQRMNEFATECDFTVWSKDLT
jgi:GNAT superfamily N-acetyltransferase